MAAALAIVLAVIVLATIAVSSHTRNPNVIFVSGNMEITEVDVSFRIAGRMVERYVDEGDTISKNQPVALLELKDLQLQVAERKQSCRQRKTLY